MRDFDAIVMLSRYPLKELHKRQWLADGQAKSAYDAQNIIALEQIRHEQDLLSAAMRLKCFGFELSQIELKDALPLKENLNAAQRG